jgi:uncharacterized protein (TIGR02246 family)
MNSRRRIVIAVLATLVVAGTAGSLYQSWAQDRKAPAEKDADKADSPEVAAVRKTAEDFVKAFNSGNAKTVAAFWTKEGEYVGPDGETLRGRDAIEKGYTEFFKKNPKASIEVEIESLRLLGRNTALEEGSLKLKLQGDKEPGVSRYSVLHVREEDGWRVATVREWVPDVQELVTLKDLEWMLGDWTAKSEEAELRISYAWDDAKAFLQGRYTLKRGGKVASSGTQIIGKNHAGGLRSWVFDSSGTHGESVWLRDENRWIIEAAGILPDGSEVTAQNILIPLGKDAFTWQSIERTVAGSPMPDTAPIKVTRAKTDK